MGLGDDETSSRGSSKTIAERFDPPPVSNEDPGAFGRRVAREIFDEYLKESRERAARRESGSTA